MLSCRWIDSEGVAVLRGPEERFINPPSEKHQQLSRVGTDVKTLNEKLRRRFLWAQLNLFYANAGEHCIVIVPALPGSICGESGITGIYFGDALRFA